MTDEEILRLHLSRWSLPFDYGEADCLLSVANYCNDLRPIGIDYGATWRGLYNDEAGAIWHLEKGGGGTGVMRRALVDNGWSVASEPGRGYPICSRIDGHDIGGIYLGGGFSAFRLPGRGRIDLRAKIIEAYWK